MKRIVEYVTERWVEILVLSLGQVVVGGIASLTVNSFVGSPVIRDLGVVALWVLIIVGGFWVVARRFPASTGLSPDNESAASTHMGLGERMRRVAPELVEAYPMLNTITPPSVIGELATAVYDFYRSRRLKRPRDEAPGVHIYDNETLLDYEERFADAVEVARDYLETQGVELDTDVKDAEDVRRIARRLKTASDFRRWPSQRPAPPD